MIAGGVFNARVTVKQYGVAVTGLLSGSFTVAGYVGTASFSPSFTVTEIGNGDYLLNITSSGTAGWQNYKITSSAGIVRQDTYSGWVCLQDADTLFAAVIRPVGTVAGGTLVSTELPLSIIANRYTSFNVAVVDQTGAVVDLSGYNNWKFSVWDKTHTASIFTGTNPTGSNLGVVAWTVPENAAFYAQMDSQIAAGNDQIDLYYDVIADAAATTSKTTTILRGKITMYRYEGPA